MRVLVTGGAGFLGSHVCRILAARGHEPVAFDLRPSGSGWKTIQGSVLDRDALARAGRVEAVVHAAALTDLWRPRAADFESTNLGGTISVARFAASQDARFLLVSSYVALAARGAPLVIDETMRLGPGSLFGPYARSKRAAEEAASELVSGAVVVRPSALIGPGDRGPTPPMRMIADLATGQLPGLMEGRIDLVDVRDVAEAIVTALETDKAGTDYLLCGHDVGFRDLAASVEGLSGVAAPKLVVPRRIALAAAIAEELAGRLSGRKPRAVRAGVQMAALRSRFSHRKATEELGFRPRPWEESVRDALADLGHRAAG